MRKGLSKLGSSLSKKIGHAIGAYNMIEEGDKILVGVSGGKDSLTLLSLLQKRQQWAPVTFKLHAVHVNLTQQMSDAPQPAEALRQLFDSMNIPHSFINCPVDHSQTTEHCFWCSWNRRKALFTLAKELGCNKIALGHHKDDIIETTLLNMLFLGHFSTMNPYQQLFNGTITIIRPLVFCEEKDIEAFSRESDFPINKIVCPYGIDSNRAFIKELISSIQTRSPYVKDNIFRSIARVRADYIDIRQEKSEMLLKL